jgi:mRNA interferase RelE/StbE
MPANLSRLIVTKIDQYADDPASLANNVKLLEGEFEGLKRLRVGDWRVIMDDRGRILEVKPRGGAYE